MGELAEAIIKIVKSDPEIRSGLGLEANPPKVRSRVGYARADSAGHITSSGGAEGDDVGAPGATTEADPENAGTEDAVNSPGSFGNGDGTAGGGGTDETADTVDSQNLGDQLQSVSGNDYTSGTDDGAVKVNANSPDGFGYDTPNGWSDPDTEPDAYAGKSWIGGSAVANLYYASTYGLGQGYVTHDSFVAEILSWAVWDEIGSVSGWGHFSYTKRVTFQVKLTNQIVTQRGGYLIDTPVGETNIAANHPANGVCDLAWDEATGKFKGHDLDPDCTTAQKTGADTIYIQNNGARKKLERLANGGFKITDVDGSNIVDPNGYTRIYNAAGIMTDIYPTGTGEQVN